MADEKERKTLEQRHQMTDLERLRHSCAHVMATAIARLWPEAQFAAGPPVEGGYYYDLELDYRISTDDFEKSEAEMKKVVKENQTFERVVVSREEAMEMAKSGRLAAVAELAKSTDAGFGKDPRLGPWVGAIRNDPGFALHYASFDLEHYKLIVAGMSRTLLDRDSAPGAEPEDMMRLNIPTLIVPGDDSSHATSAARYLQECLPAAEYWDVPPEGQTESTAPARVIDFLDRVSAGN